MFGTKLRIRYSVLPAECRYRMRELMLRLDRALLFRADLEHDGLKRCDEIWERETGDA